MENRTLTLGSLFDGSGGFPLGGMISGIAPLWSAEIEPFCVRVTEKRFPAVKQLGDISKIHGGEIPHVDIITFGSPCQDMSIAGRREGLDGSRSSLFYEAIRIIKEMRCATNGQYPRYAVWENVKGAFSSNKGEDFRAVLQEFCSVKEQGFSVPRCDKWKNAGCILGDSFSVAWRLLDAQYWGVPQRRERIYAVADFAGTSAGNILFESEGVSGYSAEGFRAWQGIASRIAEGAGETGCICLNDQGGERMDITEDVTCTLRAESHHPPVVMDGDAPKAAGFCTEHSAKARGIGYEEEKSPTLRAGTVPAAMMFENHSQDTRYRGPLDVAQPVTANYGMGGNNQPFVVQTPKTLKIRSGCEGGGKGALVQEDLSATLGTHNDQTLFQPQAFGVCSKTSHSMMSDNPHSGFYEAQTSRCLDANGGNPTCNQGGIAIVQEDDTKAFHVNQRDEVIDLHGKSGALMATRNTQMQTFVVEPKGTAVIEGNGQRPSHRGDGYAESDKMYTLNTVERHAVAYQQIAESPVYHASKASFFIRFSDEIATDTIVASDYKDPPTVSEEPCYIVRRLTPVECARLQGFPDWWCDGLGSDEPSDEEVARWMEIFEMHRKALGKSTKPKTANQVKKWLRNPYSDSAAYKMWGNGVALPNVVFVLSGIVYYAQYEGE